MLGKRCLFLVWAMLLVCGVSGWSVPVPAAAHDRDVVDVNVFYEPLARHGSWITVQEHGRVWIPRGVRRDWRPYNDGRWVYSDVGWTWVSDYEWGWAPFHYGRWNHHARYGWYWVPDRVWGPAWVSWRHRPGWVGWAPLPPRVGFQADIGLGAAQISVNIAPQWFSFVEERHLLAPRVRSYVAPPRRNIELVRVTQNVTNYTVINNRIVNRSIDVKNIERATKRPVVVHRIVEVDSPEKARGPRVRTKEREIVLVRPDRGREQRDESNQARQRRDNNAQERREQPGQEERRERRDAQSERQNRPEGVTAREPSRPSEAEHKAQPEKTQRQQRESQQQAQPAEERLGSGENRRQRDREAVQQAPEQSAAPGSPENQEEQRARRQRRQQLREEQSATQRSPQSADQAEERSSRRRQRDREAVQQAPEQSAAPGSPENQEEQRARRQRRQQLREEQRKVQSPAPSIDQGASTVPGDSPQTQP